MIYIKTKFGWYYTGENDIHQCKIHWNAFAQAYWDSEMKDFVWPMTTSCYRTMGLPPIDPKTKLQMWTMGKDFPLFDEGVYLAKMQDIKKMYDGLS